MLTWGANWANAASSDMDVCPFVDDASKRKVLASKPMDTNK